MSTLSTKDGIINKKTAPFLCFSVLKLKEKREKSRLGGERGGDGGNEELGGDWQAGPRVGIRGVPTEPRRGS